MIETILAAFAVGTIWFWLLTFIVSIIFIASIENDHFTFPTITALVVGLLYWKPIMACSWQTILISIAGYVLLGITWSLFKWYRHVNKVAAQYKELWGNKLTEDQMIKFKYAIKVSGHKSKLIGWIVWWPWSLLWNLTGDFFNFIYDTMVNSYQKISDHFINKFEIIDDKK